MWVKQTAAARRARGNAAEGWRGVLGTGVVGVVLAGVVGGGCVLI